MSKFRHLNVPSHWEHYWSKYPEGYTILEALLNWVKQVDDLTDLVNNWDDYLNEFVQKFDKRLRESVAAMLNEWLEDGTLAKIINEDVFNMKVDRDEFNNYAGQMVPVKGDGTDESAIVQKVIDDLVSKGNSGKIVFPRGSFKFGNIVVPPRFFLEIQGQGGRHTVFEPTKDQLFIIGGAQNTDYFRLSKVAIFCDKDKLYNKPLFDLRYVRNVRLEDVTSIISGTGTLFGLDSTYLVTSKDVMLRMGRYGVGFDLNNRTSASEQQDTYSFDNTTIFGNMGVILRRTGGNYHGLAFNGLKVLNLITDGDYGTYAESSTSAAYGAGATQINVTTVSGFSPSDPIVIGYGESVELNKIASISGTTIYLAKPLSYAQPSGRQVLKGGVGISLANPFNVDMRSFHSEGQAVGVMIDSAKGLDFHSNYIGSGEFLRICGGAQDIKIGTTIMDGTDRNIVVKIPAWNTNTNLTRINMEGPFVKPSGSPDIVVQEGFDKNLQYKMNVITGGIYEELINIWANSGESVKERIVMNAKEQFRRTYDGEMRWRDQVSFDYIREKTAGVMDGGHLYCEGKWDGGTLAMGGYHLWVDSSNRLRIKYGLPTSEFDGTAVGVQS